MENDMIKFDLSTDIYRPLQQVFAFVAAPENDFYWQYGTLRSAKLSEGEICIGALFRTVGHFMGRRIERVYEVTEFNPNERYGFKSLSGPMDSRTLYTFETIKGSTRINHSIQISLDETLTSNPVSAEKTVKTVKKEYRENLALLKDLLEASRAEMLPEGTSLDSQRRKSGLR
jgi:polyketide cyclase/dehydrase/lipid transport protein